jgi:hypothetical protein
MLSDGVGKRNDVESHGAMGWGERNNGKNTGRQAWNKYCYVVTVAMLLWQSPNWTIPMVLPLQWATLQLAQCDNSLVKLGPEGQWHTRNTYIVITYQIQYGRGGCQASNLIQPWPLD